MKYELLLQVRETGQPFDVDAVEAALVAKGATKRPDGALNWRLTSGDVEVYRVLEAGKAGALAVKTPFGEKVELLEEVLSQLGDVAGELALRVVDPQLAREVTLKDAGLVTEQFLLNAKYAGEYMGVSEAIPVSFAPAADKGLSFGTRMLLLVVAFMVFAYLGFRALTG